MCFELELSISTKLQPRAMYQMPSFSGDIVRLTDVVSVYKTMTNYIFSYFKNIVSDLAV